MNDIEKLELCIQQIKAITGLIRTIPGFDEDSEDYLSSGYWDLVYAIDNLSSWESND